MRAVIYARFSSSRQREESIEGQIRECTEYADRNGINIVGTYIDRALSASKDTDKRLDFLRMIDDSAHRAFDIVLVWKLDRFARSRSDSVVYKQVLKKNGVRVMSVTENISENPEGIILESMLEGMAEFYSAELSRKIHRGQKENALKGRENGGSVLLGYKLGTDRRLEIDPLTAPIALEVFTRYAGGEVLQSIVDDLNRRGLKTNRGRPFSIGSFSVMFNNRKYIGEYHYKDIVIPDSVPAIVPNDLFEKVQIRKEKNKRAPARAKAEQFYLLTTKLFCGDCNKMMVGESGTSKTGRTHYYYKCVKAKRKSGCERKAVKRDWIEDIIVSRTTQMIMDDELMERIINKLVKIQGKENPDIKALRKQLAQKEKGIGNILDAIEAGIYTISTQKRLDDLEAQKTELEKALSLALKKNPVMTREQISYHLYRYRLLDVKNPEHRRRLIDTFLNSAYVFDDRIVLTYNYKDGTDTVSLANMDSSDIINGGPPEKNTR